MKKANEAVSEVVRAAKVLLATHRVFRSKPVGAPGSLARMQQDDEIAAEDALIAAINRFEQAA